MTIIHKQLNDFYSLFACQIPIYRTVILVEKFKSVAHYTLQAKSCVLQSKNEKSSKILLLFYNVLKNPYGKRPFFGACVLFYTVSVFARCHRNVFFKHESESGNAIKTKFIGDF